MPLLFSLLEQYNLLSKQPNYTCGLFFSDLKFMVVSWARAIMSISKKAWTFPGRHCYYILYLQKLIESPTTVRQKEERDIPGPRDNLEGKSCLADSFLVRWPCHSLCAPRWLPTLCLGYYNSDALKIKVHVSFWMVIFSGPKPRNGIAGSYDTSTFSVSRNLHAAFHCGFTIYIPTMTMEGFYSLYVLCSNYSL